MTVRLLNLGSLLLTALAAAGGDHGQGAVHFIHLEPRAMARVVHFNSSGPANGNPIAGEYAIEYGKSAWQSELRLEVRRDDPRQATAARQGRVDDAQHRLPAEFRREQSLEIRFSKHRLTTVVQPKI
ncbi:MAG: hypothetical protein EXS13_12670 [Planctomycetes bacterium]|nr:hypothetical protein [Planctomycetota bacterium]